MHVAGTATGVHPQIVSGEVTFHHAGLEPHPRTAHPSKLVVIPFYLQLCGNGGFAISQWAVGIRTGMLACLVVSHFGRNVGISSKIIGFAVIVLVTGCKSDPVWTTSSEVSKVRLISDSPDMPLLISAQKKSDAAELRWLQESRAHDERVRGVKDRRRHPELYAPTLLTFIETMATKPGFAVRGGSACRLVERSHARCAPDPLDTYAFVKVHITKGPNRGQEGWACEVRDVVSTTPKFF